LDAAEYLFAEHGVDATSVRAIGFKAKLNPALVHYYFASKDELLRRVIERRAGEINQTRQQAMLSLFAESAPGLPHLEQVLDAFIRPAVEFGRDEPRGGRSYTRLLDWMSAAIDPRSLQLISDNFDPIAQYTIKCIRRVVPTLSQANAVDCYLCAVRISFLLMSPTGRASKLAQGATSDVDAEQAIAFAVRFVAAGIREIAGATKAQKTRDRKKHIDHPPNY
jgi:AcrR family transcriptional regulator